MAGAPWEKFQGAPTVDVGVETADRMEAIDNANGKVDVKVMPDGKVIDNSKVAAVGKPWEKFKPDTAKIVEPPKPEVGHPALGDMNKQLGAAEGGASLISGAFATPIAGLGGLGAAIGKAFGLTDADPAEIIKKVQGALTYQPDSATGKKVVDVVSYPFEKLAQGGDIAGQKVMDVTKPLLGTEGSAALGTAVSTGIQSLPLVAGKAGRMVKESGLVKGMTDATDAANAKANLMAAPKNEVIATAKEAGLAMPPSQVNPSLANKAAEGLSGAAKVSKRLSIQNQPVINDLIRKDIGLAEDIPATREALAGVRAEAGKAYEAIKQVGTITNDAKYFEDLGNITKSYDTAAESYAGVANPVADTIKSLKVETASAPAAIEMVKILRGKADVAYRTGDAPLGKAYKGAAQAVDDSLGRYLDKDAEFFNDPAMKDAISKYQAAREQIAKTYTAEKALNPATGNFDAQVYRRELAKGKPLSGNAKVVADFASTFKDAAKLPERTGGDTFGYGDALVGGAKAMATGSLMKGAMSLGVRPGMRAIVTSKPYQKIMVNPQPAGPSLTRRSLSTLADLQSNPAISLAELSAERRQ